MGFPNLISKLECLVFSSECIHSWFWAIEESNIFEYKTKCVSFVEQEKGKKLGCSSLKQHYFLSSKVPNLLKYLFLNVDITVSILKDVHKWRHAIFNASSLFVTRFIVKAFVMLSQNPWHPPSQKPIESVTKRTYVP